MAIQDNIGQWRDVSAHFNDVNAAMSGALGGISRAGTVFGEMRKSILDEEQRAIDNAYRQMVFDENMRQFDTKLNEDIRQFGLKHDLDVDRFNRAKDEFEMSYWQTERKNEADAKYRLEDLMYKNKTFNANKRLHDLQVQKLENELEQTNLQQFSDTLSGKVLSSSPNDRKMIVADLLQQRNKLADMGKANGIEDQKLITAIDWIEQLGDKDFSDSNSTSNISPEAKNNERLNLQANLGITGAREKLAESSQKLTELGTKISKAQYEAINNATNTFNKYMEDWYGDAKTEIFKVANLAKRISPNVDMNKLLPEILARKNIKITDAGKFFGLFGNSKLKDLDGPGWSTASINVDNSDINFIKEGLADGRFTTDSKPDKNISLNEIKNIKKELEKTNINKKFNSEEDYRDSLLNTTMGLGTYSNPTLLNDNTIASLDNMEKAVTELRQQRQNLKEAIAERKNIEDAWNKAIMRKNNSNLKDIDTIINSNMSYSDKKSELRKLNIAGLISDKQYKEALRAM